MHMSLSPNIRTPAYQRSDALTTWSRLVTILNTSWHAWQTTGLRSEGGVLTVGHIVYDLIEAPPLYDLQVRRERLEGLRVQTRAIFQRVAALVLQYVGAPCMLPRLFGRPLRVLRGAGGAVEGADHGVCGHHGRCLHMLADTTGDTVLLLQNTNNT